MYIDSSCEKHSKHKWSGEYKASLSILWVETGFYSMQLLLGVLFYPGGNAQDYF